MIGVVAKLAPGQRLLPGAGGPGPLLGLCTALAGGVNTHMEFRQKHRDELRDQAADSPGGTLGPPAPSGYALNRVPSKSVC